MARPLRGPFRYREGTPGVTGKHRRWRKHPAAAKEFAELPLHGRQGLLELMRRVRAEETVLPREQQSYGKGLWGLKYSEARNEFRCYYAHVGDQGQVLLAVAFDYKKTEKADLEAARERLRQWQASHDRRLRERK